LVKCGALDSTGSLRRGMLTCLEQALAWGSKQQSDKLLGQGSIFDLGEPTGDAAPRHHPAIPAGEEFAKNELLKLEKETLGLYVSDHPLTPIRDQLRRKTDCAINELERRRDGEIVVVGGIVSALKQMTTKKGDPKDFAGEAPVYVDLVTTMGPKLLELGPNYRVRPVPDFFAEVKALLGEAAVA